MQQVILFFFVSIQNSYYTNELNKKKKKKKIKSLFTSLFNTHNIHPILLRKYIEIINLQNDIKKILINLVNKNLTQQYHYANL